MNAYLTTQRLPQSPSSQILSTAAQITDNIGSNSRETRPLPRRNSSGAPTCSSADTITLAEFLAQNDRHPRPGVPHIPHDTRIVKKPRNPPRKCHAQSNDTQTPLRRTYAVADLNALSRNPRFYLSPDSSSDSESEQTRSIESGMELAEEDEIMHKIYTLGNSHPKVYSMMDLADDFSDSHSQLVAPPGITVIPASSSTPLAPIRFEIPLDPAAPSGPTRAMSFVEFQEYHKDMPAVVEYLKDPVLCSIIDNILSRGYTDEIKALRENLPNLQDFRKFRTSLVKIIGKTDTMLTRRRLHDPVRKFFRSSPATELNNSENNSQYEPAQRGRPIPGTTGNAFLIEEEEAFLTHALQLLSDSFCLDVCEAITILLSMRFPHDSGIRFLVNSGCFESLGDRTHFIST